MVELLAEWAVLPLRIIIGIIFIYHGYPKLFKDFKGTKKFVKSIGFIPANFWAFMLAFAEFFGGVAILLGVFTRIAAILIFIVMCVASYFNIFKWKKPFGGGYEFDLMLLAGLITIFLLGAGNLSIDGIIGWVLG